MESTGWRCVWVSEGQESNAPAFERDATPSASLLLVVDYAEARPGLDRLLEEAARDQGRLCILLLARQAGDWWQRLQAGPELSATWCVMRIFHAWR